MLQKQQDMLHFHIIFNNYVFAAGFTIWRSNASPHRRLCQECDVDSQVNIGEGGQKGIFSCRSRVQKLAFVSQWKRIYRSQSSFPWRCIDPDIWHKKIQQKFRNNICRYKAKRKKKEQGVSQSWIFWWGFSASLTESPFMLKWTSEITHSP